MPTNRARMISMASEALKTICPSRIVHLPSAGNRPKLFFTCTKKMSEATAITISGTDERQVDE